MIRRFSTYRPISSLILDTKHNIKVIFKWTDSVEVENDLVEVFYLEKNDLLHLAGKHSVLNELMTPEQVNISCSLADDVDISFVKKFEGDLVIDKSKSIYLQKNRGEKVELNALEISQPLKYLKQRHSMLLLKISKLRN